MFKLTLIFVEAITQKSIIREVAVRADLMVLR